MPKVLGFDASMAKKCTCKNCTAIVEYIPSERKMKSIMDYGGFTDSYYVIVCPGCGKDIEVK